jgi:hypothetical protein
MSRKRCHRITRAALPPKGLRIMLKPETRRALAIAHHTHVDLVARGQATIDTVWEMAAAALGWLRMAQALEMGEPEMHADIDVLMALLQRWERTGRVGYSGPELQQARAGLEVVDELARLIDWPTACAAINWAEDKVNAIRDAREKARAQETPHSLAVMPASESKPSDHRTA